MKHLIIGNVIVTCILWFLLALSFYFLTLFPPPTPPPLSPSIYQSIHTYIHIHTHVKSLRSYSDHFTLFHVNCEHFWFVPTRSDGSSTQPKHSSQPSSVTLVLWFTTRLPAPRLYTASTYIFHLVFLISSQWLVNAVKYEINMLKWIVKCYGKFLKENNFYPITCESIQCSQHLSCAYCYW